MAVDGEGAGSVAAAGIVAHKVSVVVTIGLDADGVFELGDKGNGAEDFTAGWVLAEDALGGDAADAWSETLEGEGVFAVAAVKDETGAVFEADGVGDLGFERGDV